MAKQIAARFVSQDPQIVVSLGTVAAQAFFPYTDSKGHFIRIFLYNRPTKCRVK